MLNVIGAKTVTYSSPPKLRATDVIRATATSFVELAIPSEQGAPPRKIEPVQDEAQSVEKRSCRCVTTEVDIISRALLERYFGPDVNPLRAFWNRNRQLEAAGYIR